MTAIATTNNRGEPRRRGVASVVRDGGSDAFGVWVDIVGGGAVAAGRGAGVSARSVAAGAGDAGACCAGPGSVRTVPARTVAAGAGAAGAVSARACAAGPIWVAPLPARTVPARTVAGGTGDAGAGFGATLAAGAGEAGGVVDDRAGVLQPEPSCSWNSLP
jgi:hypothetical protein